MPAPSTLRIGKATVRLRDGRVELDGRTFRLSGLSCRLLRCLAEARGKVVSRDHLLQAVWGLPPRHPTRRVDAAVRSLRVQLEEDPSAPKCLLTVYGGGYRLLTTPDPRGQALIGRESELAQAAEALSAGGRVTLVGPPGAGSSTLGLHLSGALWLRCELDRVWSPGGLCLALARSIDLPTPDWLWCQQPLRAVVQALVELAPEGLFLDDLRGGGAHARELIDTLPRELPVLCVAPAPLGVEGEQVVAVPPLSPGGASELWRLLGGRDERLLEASGGLPSALEIAARDFTPLRRWLGGPDKLIPWVLGHLRPEESELLMRRALGLSPEGPEVVTRLEERGLLVPGASQKTLKVPQLVRHSLCRGAAWEELRQQEASSLALQLRRQFERYWVGSPAPAREELLQLGPLAYVRGEELEALFAPAASLVEPVLEGPYRQLTVQPLEPPAEPEPSERFERAAVEVVEQSMRGRATEASVRALRPLRRPLRQSLQAQAWARLASGVYEAFVGGGLEARELLRLAAQDFARCELPRELFFARGLLAWFAAALEQDSAHAEVSVTLELLDRPGGLALEPHQQEVALELALWLGDLDRAEALLGPHPGPAHPFHRGLLAARRGDEAGAAELFEEDPELARQALCLILLGRRPARLPEAQAPLAWLVDAATSGSLGEVLAAPIVGCLARFPSPALRAWVRELHGASSPVAP